MLGIKNVALDIRPDLAQGCLNRLKVGGEALTYFVAGDPVEPTLILDFNDRPGGPESAAFTFQAAFARAEFLNMIFTRTDAGRAFLAAGDPTGHDQAASVGKILGLIKSAHPGLLPDGQRGYLD